MSIRNRSTVPEAGVTRRFREYLSHIERAIENSREEHEALGGILQGLRRLFLSLGKPVFQKREIYPSTPPRSDMVNQTFLEAEEDIQTLFEEQSAISSAALLKFNERQMAEEYLSNRIKAVSDKVADFVVLSKNASKRYATTWQDSFINEEKIEQATAKVRVNEGIVTLQVTNHQSQMNGARVVSVEGSEGSFPGNDFVAMQASSREIPGPYVHEEQSMWILAAEEEPRMIPGAMLNSDPDKWFEWQMINVPEEAKKPNPPAPYPDTKGYGWHWADGEPIYNGRRGTDDLKTTYIIELGGTKEINMITLDPYFPPQAVDLLLVEGVYTSLNGEDWELVHEPGEVFDIGHDTQIADPDLPNKDAYRGRGIWVFPMRKARFLRFHLKAPEAYPEKIAHKYWTASYDIVTTTVTEKRRFFFFRTREESIKREHQKERIEGFKISKEDLMAQVRDKDLSVAAAVTGAAIGATIGGTVLGVVGFVIGGLLGAGFGTTTTHSQHIENLEYSENFGLDVYEGWRWVVGVRTIDALRDTYAMSSTLISKPIVTGRPIRNISLSVDEIIPEELYASDLASKNSWIKYYVSVDDGASWVRISPQEHQKIRDDMEFPPKIIALSSDEEPETSQPRTVIQTNGGVQSIRLRAEFHRPESMPGLTPVLSRWSVNMTLQGDIPS